MIAVPERTVWRQVDRITADLAASPRLCAFLRHIVEAALRGSPEELKEAVVGIEVFGRPPGYDPKRDPIVRVEARRLRRKLEEYYAGIGRHDPLLLRIPTGGYAPTLVPRRTVSQEHSERGAVLTLAFRDEEHGSEGLADGLSSDLARILRRAPNLRVTRARSDDHLPDPTRRSYRLEGRISAAGPKLRVHVRLVAHSGGVRWSGTFEARAGDGHIVRDAIASGVTAALGVRRRILRRSSAGATGEPYSLCLKGRYWLARSVTRAARLFEEALAIDPACAAAYAGLADCWHSRGIWGPESPERARRHAEACARLALELDPDLPEAHSALAIVAHGFDWDEEACATALARCLDLEPDHAHAASRYGHAYHLPLAQWEQTIDWIEQASTLDPVSPQFAYDLAAAHLWTRRYDRAIEEAYKCLELWPRHGKAQLVIICAHALQGRWQDALDACDQLDPEDQVFPLLSVLRGCVHALRRDDERARQQLDALNRMSDRCYVPQAFLAMLHAALGDREAAFRALDDCCRRREPGVRYVLSGPFLDCLRADARFADLLARVRVSAAPDSRS